MFKSEKFKQFCKERSIQHTFCQYRAKGKVERKIRTINERLRINRKIIVERDSKEILNILPALRTEKGADGREVSLHLRNKMVENQNL